MRRVLTALVLIPIVVYLVFFANVWLFGGVLAAVACLCFHEYRHLASAYGFGAPHWLGYIAGVPLLFVAREPWAGLLIVAASLAALALAMKARNLAHALPRAAFLALGVVYIFGCWRCAWLIRGRSPHWLMFALVVNWAGDIGAYYVGRSIGKRRLAERVSPGKTWEGTAGSLVASVLVAGAYLPRFLPGVPILQIVLPTLATNAAGQLGDLCESVIKRGAGAKDSGSLLPGHGGMLDRVDSTLFALPVVYAYLTIMG
ncbi:MAG TPA: phosphatidate cytidylyltransferase [Bryobacteraceae bacterium]|nr:phosphatidate cytidylyltransferase [Bryobacteraceae bacterium]